MNPFTGTWIANIEKSRRHANHQFQSATLTFEVNGDDVSMTHAGVNMSGKHESGTTVYKADGQEHAVSPQAPGVVAVTTWFSTHILESEGCVRRTIRASDCVRSWVLTRRAEAG